jgi:hypothetical protein
MRKSKLAAVGATLLVANAVAQNVTPLKSVPIPITLQGNIPDSTCQYESINTINQRILPNVKELVKTLYFRYWKVNLWRECQFWKDGMFCTNQNCAVEAAEEDEIPLDYKSSKLGSVDMTGASGDFSSVFGSCDYSSKDFCVLDNEASAGLCAQERANAVRWCLCKLIVKSRTFYWIFRRASKSSMEGNLRGELLQCLGRRSEQTGWTRFDNESRGWHVYRETNLLQAYFWFSLCHFSRNLQRLVKSNVGRMGTHLETDALTRKGKESRLLHLEGGKLSRQDSKHLLQLCRHYESSDQDYPLASKVQVLHHRQG